MRYATFTVLASVLLWSVIGVGSASPVGGRGVGYTEALQAKRAAAAAAAAKARRRELEESANRYKARWIRRWTRSYGCSVGRWADEAIEVGWPRAQLWTLGRIIQAESSGRPTARNAYSDCRGLLQLAPCHWSGKFDPYIPRKNLAYGLKLWRGSGWSPWVTY